MGKWIEKQVTGDSGGQYWKDVEKAVPIIQGRADKVMHQLNYDTTKLTAKVYSKGEGGDEVWTVAYWKEPTDHYHGDIEVYLNNRGVVKRVSKFEGNKEQLIYGKDERILNGMTPDQVRERLGEPDYKGAPPRNLRNLADEMWKYKTTKERTVRIEIFFKNGTVSSVDTFGE